MARHRLSAILCAFLILAVVPSAAQADETTAKTSVTLQGKPDRSGCTIWLSPEEPVRFSVLTPSDESGNHLPSREFSLRVLNESGDAPLPCTVTTGGASFQWNDRVVRSIHAVKLTESTASTVPIALVPQVNEMAGNELQSILVTMPERSGCAIVVATLDTTALPTLPADASVLGTLTLTLSNVAP